MNLYHYQVPIGKLMFIILNNHDLINSALPVCAPAIDPVSGNTQVKLTFNFDWGKVPAPHCRQGLYFMSRKPALNPKPLTESPPDAFSPVLGGSAGNHESLEGRGVLVFRCV